eukprot:4981975-Prymnesium_polylepis.1
MGRSGHWRVRRGSAGGQAQSDALADVLAAIAITELERVPKNRVGQCGHKLFAGPVDLILDVVERLVLGLIVEHVDSWSPGGSGQRDDDWRAVPPRVRSPRHQRGRRAAAWAESATSLASLCCCCCCLTSPQGCESTRNIVIS